jgi:outer membrane protein assembly factor BamC
MEIFRVIRSCSSRVLAGLSCLALLAGCSSVDNLMAGDKVDYRSASASRTSGLEVPPDLTQLSRESRYQQPNGSVSASTFQTATAAGPVTPIVPVVAPQSVGAFRMERLGNERWLSTTLSSTRSIRPASSTSSAPASSGPRPAATSTSPTAA